MVKKLAVVLLSSTKMLFRGCCTATKKLPASSRSERANIKGHHFTNHFVGFREF